MNGIRFDDLLYRFHLEMSLSLQSVAAGFMPAQPFGCGYSKSSQMELKMVLYQFHETEEHRNLTPGQSHLKFRVDKRRN